jgi:hypothetical protein
LSLPFLGIMVTVMGTDQEEKIVGRMNFLFWGSMALQGLALVAIFVGLLARGYKHHWGIWFSIGGWTAFAGGYVIRSWVRRWFYKRRDK